MKAIVLVAGVARRLAPLTDKTHKALLPVGGRPLLDRMLGALAELGVRETVLVVGHCAEQVRRLAGDRRGRMAVRYVDNPDYTRGSVLSLYAARAHLAEPVLVMDADVLFPRELLRRLLAAPAPSALLLDRGFQDTGEEVKLYTRGDRVIALGKKVVPEAWETVGEGVGFFKCGAEAGPEFVRLLRKVIEEGDGLNEYEDALHMLLGTRHVGWVDVTGLPWTEIDFAEDLRRAEADVLPHVVRLDGA
ncbi:MAG: phosphocholine cytidylyltransferase family protein [Candidatus Rokubacteria bacterium]|nr:phosphocholine cytidylyltransferase family protein [Candidatus Rokubacteria bacterium]MBI2015191.1 phosphocholine cytidylyltransferase family protein [Candidatus Rokubacteria bacterium]MBI2156701.1 phosphocholine cytidylyltransferase family protein [Candidatus Rokubacteria bacterium]MBI2491618.1 phosphocholine cytidylyltransferase family protein [Candidatus Rokubacteria bacterium]MBI4627255.1 phosphocholine cytidylyltransferase family protein [Candidatus Rokubacteria bacterium]